MLRKNNMIQLSDTQGQILHVFVEYDADHYGNIGYGLTSGGLENLGINRQTFDNPNSRIINNKTFLVANDLLKITKIEKHGKQRWIYYKITMLGVLAYLRWGSESKSTPEITYSQTFFPLITKYWKIISELYGDMMNDILRYTSLRIDVGQQLILSIQSRDLKSKSIGCSITLRIDALDVVFVTFNGTYGYQHNKRPITTLIEDKNNDSNMQLVNSFTFLFYYNLINAGSNAVEMLRLFLPRYVVVKKQNSTYYFNKEKYRKDASDFHKKLERNQETILSIIKKDPDLHKLFVQYLDEIQTKLNQNLTIKKLRKNL